MSDQQQQGPPPFHKPKPAQAQQGPANPTIHPAKEREVAEDTDNDATEDGNALIRALRKVWGWSNTSDEKGAAIWILIRIAVSVVVLLGAYVWSHMMWGWGPCPHRTHLEILREFKPELMAPAPAPQPQGRPPIIAPTGGR